MREISSGLLLCDRKRFLCYNSYRYAEKVGMMMARKKGESLLGSSVSYTLHPDVKRYTLLDNGFIETKNGNYQYERTLAKQASNQTAPRLKVRIGKNLNQLRLSVVAAKGLKKVNLYKDDQFEEARQMAEFYLDNFVKEDILIPID